jgi:hypothetical protein
VPGLDRQDDFTEIPTFVKTALKKEKRPQAVNGLHKVHTIFVNHVTEAFLSISPTAGALGCEFFNITELLCSTWSTFREPERPEVV